MKKIRTEIKKMLDLQNLPITEIEAVEDMCIQIFDDEGRTISYSKGCEQIEGQKKENILGKTIDEAYTITQSDDNPYGSIPLTVLKTGKMMKNNHVKFKTFSGKEVDVISSTYPVFSEDRSQVIAAICVFRDIGDYIKMAHTIQKLENDLAFEKTAKRNNGTVYTFRDVVGSSSQTQECIKLAKKAAKSSAPVMITGATGTGKEVFAQSIHNESPVSKGPFVALNCSAIPENLLESILFGTCKGAYTGATESKGLFEAAEAGTLFLDEINSMSMNLQSKMLRALETKLIRKVGGNDEIPIDVRIISATNQDPLQEVKEKRIRADFYYRLAVIVLILPDLKERKEDIPELISNFILNHSHILGKKVTEVSQEAYNVLLEHNWPGNVRELKHVIDQAIYFADVNDTVISPVHLPKYIYENYSNKKDYTKYMNQPKGTIKETLNSIEKQIILEAFKNCEENVSETARQLGITRQNLQHKLRSYEAR